MPFCPSCQFSYQGTEESDFENPICPKCGTVMNVGVRDRRTARSIGMYRKDNNGEEFQ
jgi:Zn-finger nucleic acid-binding protein